MRIFAGPNGSGKTTIFKAILTNEKVNLGVYVNADEIESQLNLKRVLEFDQFSLVLSQDTIATFFKNSKFSPLKRNEPELWKSLSVNDNILHLGSLVVDSYLAADLAELIRQQLLLSGISFTYETVMSHSGKVDFMKYAGSQGYRVYLYYIATEDPEINISRVKVREVQRGHSVAPEVVKSRYFKSLELLKSAVKNSNRAFIFDNSGVKAELVAEISEGEMVQRNEIVKVPLWVARYLLVG